MIDLQGIITDQANLYPGHFHFSHYPGHFHFPPTPGHSGEDFSIFANKKTSCYGCRHHQGHYQHHHLHHQHCHQHQHHHHQHCHPHHHPHHLPRQVLSNYAVDEIYIRETPNWMFTEEKVSKILIQNVFLL